VGDPMTMLAAGASLAGAGLKAEGVYEQGKAQASSYQWQAYQAEKDKEIAVAQREFIGAEGTQKMMTDLGNLHAIRAAANTDPMSPTGGALENIQRIDFMNMAGAMATKTAQADADAAAMQYYGAMSQYAEKAGKYGAGVSLFTSIVPSLFSPSFGLGKTGMGSLFPTGAGV